MYVSKVSPKGQVTIPEPLRARMGVEPGSRVVWVEDRGSVSVRPLVPIDQLAGRFGPQPGGEGRPLGEALLEQRAADARSEAGRGHVHRQALPANGVRR
jgi:AbrB family looped-hinge helix DNA binding protein